MEVDPRITALRAAAAKLAEALADAPNLPHPIRALANTLASVGIGLQGEEIPALWSNEPGWIWMAEAARLRLLVEALLLEQDATPPIHASGQWWREEMDERDEALGALVRDWAEGLST